MASTLFIISAPSGTGKTTLVRALCKSVPNLQVSVSCTTRARRPGEQDGVDYYFLDAKTFDEMAAKNRFLEHKQVFGNRYGTPRQWVADQLRTGNDIILEIDWQGAREVRAMLPEKTTGIFILPPSLAVLEQRLRGRGQDDEDTIRRRTQDALNELSHYDEFDYLVINDEFAAALEELKAIVAARRRGEIYATPGDRRGFAARLIAEGSKIQ